MIPITILVADDHPLIVKALADFLSSHGYNIVATETNGIRAFHKIINLKPRIALLDIEMPDLGGLEIAEKLFGKSDETFIIFNTVHREQSIIQRANELGVKGYLLKEYALDQILECIQSICNGKPYFGNDLTVLTELGQEENILTKLSPSEIKILRFISQEKSTKDIAERLFIAEKTVEKHRSNIIRKLGLSQTKNSLLIWSLQHKEELLGIH
ncbi:DNA-binding response regulator [Emticicia aquatilis]|uniref:DNA-binding response regulator n=1 Tax=Emticicia aquatilis TaxID=1537369 RepID=A0A917DZ74_9BACT|nr:response regulator transcription factor [Emticicia aquatilis]GGD82561.1 DNA-binding response regulator [Emticicia aquatilis]